MYVSVVLPLGNTLRFISKSIESVLVQTHKEFELLVVDDGSTDGSADIAKLYAKRDSRVRVIEGAKSGISRTLNHGIHEASFEWMVRMDADDVMVPNRIERQIDFVRRNPDVSVASSFVQNIDTRGRIIGIGTSSLTTREAVRRELAENRLIGFHHPAVICRRAVVQEVGGYRNVFPEDIDLWNRIAEAGYTVLVQPEFLLEYRVHRHSLSYQNIDALMGGLRWMQECALRRRQGMPELTVEEFSALQARRPLMQKVLCWCEDQGFVMYKRAVVNYAERDYFRTAAFITAAGLLSPYYVGGQLLAKYPGARRYGAMLRMQQTGTRA